MPVEVLMNDVAEQPEALPEVLVPAGPGPGAGVLLRQAREAAGVSVEALAVTLKVPVKKLEALEADQWDTLPDAAFTRSLAASICRTLKLDPAPVLARLPSLVTTLMPNGSGLNEPFRGASFRGAGASALNHLSRPFVLAAIALLLGALVLILLPSVQPFSIKASSVPTEDPKIPALSPASAVELPVAGMLIEPTVPASAAISSSAGLSESASMRPVAVASAAPTLDAKALQDAPSISSGGIIVFKTSGSSWIQVTDSRGVTVLRKLMVDGDSSSISGALPLTVLVGKADVTRVEVRGKPLDLKPMSRDNIARFEVK
jgi:cytoskeleton protein RodZ